MYLNSDMQKLLVPHWDRCTKQQEVTQRIKDHQVYLEQLNTNSLINAPIGATQQIKNNIKQTKKK